MTRFPPGPDTGRPFQPPAPNPVSLHPHHAHITWKGTWDRDDGNLTYRLYREGDPDPLKVVHRYSRLWDEPTMSYNDSGLAPGTYHYKVTASDGINVSIRSNAGTVTVK